MITGKEKRNGTIDFFRFIFAVGIVMYHARPLFQKELFVCGYIGVEFFFMVSGFLLMKKADAAGRRQKAGDVFEENLSVICHKCKNILPFFVPALVCAFFFRFLFSGADAKKIFHDLTGGVAELAFLQMFGFENGALIDVAWYLSALFAVSFLLYPILRKQKKAFVLYAAPLLVLFIYGYFSKTLNGAVNMPFHWFGFCFKGLLRSLAGMSLGCVSYVFSEWLKQRYRQKRRSVFTVAEWFGYLLALVYLIFYPVQTSMDFLIIALLFFSVTISFSEISCTTAIFDGKLFRFLGEWSLPIFLNHSYVRENIKRLFAQSADDSAELVLLYLLLVAGLSLGNFALGRFVQKKWRQKEKLKEISG